MSDQQSRCCFIILDNGQIERSQTIKVPHVQIRTSLDQELHDLNAAGPDGEVEGRVPVEDVGADLEVLYLEQALYKVRVMSHNGDHHAGGQCLFPLRIMATMFFSEELEDMPVSVFSFGEQISVIEALLTHKILHRGPSLSKMDKYLRTSCAVKRANHMDIIVELY